MSDHTLWYTLSTTDPIYVEGRDGTQMWAVCVTCREAHGIPVTGPHARTPYQAAAEAEASLLASHQVGA